MNEVPGRAGGWIPGWRLLRGAHPPVAGGVVLAYHDVGELGQEFTSHSVSPDRLRQQLEAVRSWGIRFVELGTMVDMVSAGQDPQGLASVVFDDCLVGVHRHALPVLVEMGIPATLFAVSDAFGASPPPWWPEAARVMTRSELSDMVDAGVTVGSHSRSHASLIELRGPSLDDEVRGSQRELEDLIQEPVDLFAYPFGHYDPVVREAVVRAGYRAAFSFLNGRVLPALNLHRLPRMNMHQGLWGLRFARQLARGPAQWPDTERRLVRHEERV